ncbi:hypothetical protein [Lactobacillus sp. ESL0681]|uniref:hypothetical protein n=1 Tax=Lactobacillus sp. ESL0681 TaxID=2983211 RepID=UPI0023F745A3|nr:hypothetical protein [Lactobacillus sp. ESL0681]WEV40964.1 hypothetical protein OZX59_03330 [Lactobacillus sp. ESL0681]
MKKVISACLVIVTILTYLMTINFYQSKDYDEVAKMGQTTDSYQIYVQDSQVSPDEELAFFKQLSKQYGLSVVLTTNGTNNTVQKSVISNPATFPTKSFRLSKTASLDNANNNEFYASFQTNRATQKGTIPVFAKSNRIILQPLARYFKDKRTVDGVYTIIPGRSDKKIILKRLSHFYGISRQKLTTPSAGRKTEYFNRTIVIIGFILFLTVLVFLLVNAYYPSAQANTIGIKKLNGWKNNDIFFTLINFGIITIIATALILNLTTYLLFPYQPHGLIFTFILGQLVILLLYLLANAFTFFLIKKVSIADLLNGSFHFNLGINVAYCLKILMTIASGILLFGMSSGIKEAIENYQLQEQWEKEGNLFTLNSTSEYILTNEHEANRTMSKWFRQLAQDKGAYYVNSAVYSVKDILPEQNSWRQQTNQKISIISANRNFVQAKLPQLQSYLQSRKPTFLVPKKERKHAKQIKYLLQCFRYNDLSSKEQNKIKPTQVNIQLKYYDESINPITYNVALPKRFNNPIVEIVEESQMTDSQQMTLSNTDKNSPIKLVNNQKMKTQLHQLAQNPKIKRLNLKFVTLNSILSTSLDSSYQGLKATVVALIVILIINLFTTVFLTLCVILNKQKQLAVERLLGFRRFDRYLLQMLIIFVLGIGEFASLLVLKASIVPLVLAIIMLVSDLAIFNLIIQSVESRDLPFLLKGGLS